MSRLRAVALALWLSELFFACASIQAQSPILGERLASKTASGHLLAFTWSSVHNWEVEDVSAKMVR